MYAKSFKFCAFIFVAVLVFLSLCSCSELEENLYPIKHKELIVKYADKYDIPCELLAAIIKTESNFNNEAVSRVGAKGLMQLMPSTAEEIAGRLGEEYLEENITDPETNIAYGSFYLKYLYRNLGENWETACAAYNAGIGKVMGWLDDSRYSEDGLTLKNIPIAETDDYVKKINKYQPKYKELYFESEVESYE